MGLVTRLNLLFVFLLVLALGATSVSIWILRSSATQMRSISLAYQVHGHVLSIKSHTYQLFKQFGDALTIGDLDRGTGEKSLTEKIRGEIAAARAAIVQEVELLGEEELEELEELAVVELEIERLIGETQRLTRELPQDAIGGRWEELWRLLDQDIDRRFYDLISSLLAEEQREVSEALAEAAARAAWQRQVALAIGLAAILLTIGAAGIVSGAVGAPVRALLGGVRAFGEGRTETRIPRLGKGEIRDLVDTFNLMADRIEAQTVALTTENCALEKIVAERTRQLERLVEELKESGDMRRRMLADVSHELRTPLTIIQGEADVAMRGGDKPAEVYREALARARLAAKHTARLVDDLLFVARTESGHSRLNVTSIDLRILAAEVIETYGPAVAMLTDLDAAPMRGDPDRVRQAMLVLLENARHHGGGAVAMHLSRTPEGYRVAVEDAGPGMSDADKKRAFERFFRGSNAAETYREGLGLGLPVALAIAQAHGGAIELLDRPGGGLVAALLLPTRPKLRAVA